MKIGDLVYWKDDMMKGYPDDNLFVVVDLEKHSALNLIRIKKPRFRILMFALLVRQDGRPFVKFFSRSICSRIC